MGVFKFPGKKEHLKKNSSRENFMKPLIYVLHDVVNIFLP